MNRLIQQIDDELIKSMENTLAAHKELHLYDLCHSSSSSLYEHQGEKIQIESSSSPFRPRQYTGCLLVSVSHTVLRFRVSVCCSSKRVRDSIVTNTSLIDQILFTCRSTFPTDRYQETALVEHLVSKILAKIQGTEMLTDLGNLGTRKSHYLEPRSVIRSCHKIH